MFEKIQAYLSSQLDIPAEEIDRDTTFESLGVDSLDTVELIMEFEKVFDVSISDDKAEKIQTVGDAVKYIEDNIKQ